MDELLYKQSLIALEAKNIFDDIVVSISDDHIWYSEPGRFTNPVALAIKDQLPSFTNVAVYDNGLMFFGPVTYRMNLKLPYQACEFLRNFESNLLVKPCTFLLSLSYEMQRKIMESVIDNHRLMQKYESS